MVNMSTMWKHVLDHKYLIKRGLRWILGNGEKIKFWHDKWIEESPLIDYIPQKLRSQIRDTTVSEFIENNKFGILLN